MVVLEACVIRRKAESGGNSGIIPLKAIWVHYQEHGKKYVVRSASQSKTQNKVDTET